MSGSHALRRELDRAGVLKATVRMLRPADRATRLEVLDLLGLLAQTPSLNPKIW